jgi:hypothetical protein
VVRLNTYNTTKKKSMKKSFYLSSLLVFCFILSSVAAKAQAPVITTDPHDTTVCSGSQTRFIAKSTGATSKIWQLSTDGGTAWDTVHNGTIYAGATGDTLKVMSSMALTGNMYRSIVSNTSGADTSAAATLTVDTLVISGSNMVCIGSTVTLTGSVAGGTWSRLHPAIDTITAAGELTGITFGFDTVKYTVSSFACAFATYPVRVDSTISAMPITGPTTTCIGGTILLSNSNVLGIHSWTVSNANATITPAGFLTGAAAGLDTVTYTITNGCNTVSSDIEIQIDAPLAPGTITGLSAVCAGSMIHLTSSVTGGTWISGNTARAVVDASGNVTGIAQGGVFISYYRSNGCGAFVTTDSITVFAAAAPISGIDSVGVGATRSLSNTSTMGTSSWSISPADTNATISSAGVVTGVHVGTATVTYTITNLCGTSSSTLVMHVGIPPVAGTITAAHDTVCVGGALALSNTTAGGPGTWSMTNSNATIDASGVVSGISRGKDTAIYTVTTGFGKTTARKTLTVYSSNIDSVKGPLTVSLGGSYFMNGYPAGGTWSSNNDTAATLIGPATGFFIVVDYGSAIFTYKISNALCGDDTMTYVFNFPRPASVTATNNIAENLKVYPNPANGAFTFNLASDINTDVNVVITNVVGAKVKEFTTTTNRSTDVQLDQPAGMYIITASTDAGTYTSKIMIAK